MRITVEELLKVIDCTRAAAAANLMDQALACVFGEDPPKFSSDDYCDFEVSDTKYWEWVESFITGKYPDDRGSGGTSPPGVCDSEIDLFRKAAQAAFELDDEVYDMMKRVYAKELSES